MDIQVIVEKNEIFKIERLWEDREWSKPIFKEFGEQTSFTTDDAGVATLKAFNVPIIASIYGEFPPANKKEPVKKAKNKTFMGL